MDLKVVVVDIFKVRTSLQNVDVLWLSFEWGVTKASVRAIRAKAQMHKRNDPFRKLSNTEY